MVTHSKPWINESDRRAVDEVLASGMLAQGKTVRRFEREVAKYLGWADGVTVNCGTAALVLALKALGVDRTHEVIFPTYVCRSVMEAVLTIGAKPILCDVGQQWTMTAETVAPKITPRTAAIIVVHIFGIRADTASLKQFGVPIVEDSCQALSARADQTERGTIEVLSFHAIKCLTTGEGGMALSNDASLLEQMRGFRDGVDSHLAMRIASPMTDIQGALGLSQLVRYDDFLKRRRDIAEQYFAELYDLPVQLPECIRNESIFFRFPLRVHGDFYAYRNRFDALNVQVRQGVDALLHRISGEDRRLFPVAEQLFAETLSIPIYPTLRDVEVQAVIAACRRVLGSGRS